MIDHFLKWIKLVLLLDCNSEDIAYAFFNKVFNRFGVPAKVLSTKVWNSMGSFQELFEKALIDHHATSWDYRKVNGLIEWMV
jgi:hypothetical protein